jgi:hypothetical protein
MVENLKLPNYDSALDTIDYNAPMKTIYAMRNVRDIEWPWKTDPIRQRKRINAIKKLWACGGLSTDMKNIVEMTVNDETYAKENNNKYPLDILGFRFEYDEYTQNASVLKIVPDKVNNKLLMETLPYIPEIEKIILLFTINVSDEGLNSLFYLPILKEIIIDTPEPETHPLLITDKGIELISKHPSLEMISLRHLNITDNSLKSISENAKLIKTLNYAGETISDTGIFYLSKMESLTSLSLSRSGGWSLETPRPPSKITHEVFDLLTSFPNLKKFQFDFYDLSAPPNLETLQSIQKLDGKIQFLKFIGTKFHPKLLNEICKINSLKQLDIFSRVFKFDKLNPVSYEKIMYHLKKHNAIPDYYTELEKPYFDEFYSRKWTSIDGTFTSEACFIDLKENLVILKLKGETKEITVPFEKLSKENQKYVQQIIGK